MRVKGRQPNHFCIAITPKRSCSSVCFRYDSGCIVAIQMMCRGNVRFSAKCLTLSCCLFNERGMWDFEFKNGKIFQKMEHKSYTPERYTISVVRQYFHKTQMGERGGNGPRTKTWTPGRLPKHIPTKYTTHEYQTKREGNFFIST